MYLDSLDILVKLFDELSNKKVIIFGTGKASEKIFNILKKLSIKIDYFVDNNTAKWGDFFLETKINPPEMLLNETRNSTVVLIASIFDYEISCQLKEMSYEKDYNFFQPFMILFFKNLKLGNILMDMND